MHHSFWNIWTDSEDSDYSAEILDEKKALQVRPRYALRQRLKIIVDLSISSQLNEEKAYFLNWAKQRKGSINFCCTKMKIWTLPVKALRHIFHVFDPEHIMELELNTEWTLLELTHFAPYFGQMRNLRKLLLAPLYKNVFKIANRTGDREDKCVKEFVSIFSKFNCLQHLSMQGVHFLTDHMSQVFR